MYKTLLLLYYSQICTKNCSQKQAIHDPAAGAPCIRPSNSTMAQATIKLLQDGFNWKRALALVDNYTMVLCIVISLIIYNVQL